MRGRVIFESGFCYTSILNGLFQLFKLQLHVDNYFQTHKKAMDNVKIAREKFGYPVAIALDTKGPEIRTGVLKAVSIILKRKN